MRLKLTICILLACILINTLMTIKVSANELSSEIFEVLSIDDGLSSENITTIFQDSKGYMWIGTSNGLNRYDGEYIKVYNCDINNKNSLSSTYITDLAEDDDGNIWVGTSNGLDVLNRDKDEVIRLKDIYKYKNQLGNLKITSLLYSKYEENIMWIGTENGLIKLDIENSKTNTFYHEDDNINSLTHSSITSLKEYKDGSIWVGTKYGINIIDKNLNISSDEIRLYDDRTYIYNIEIDDLGYVWISTKRGIFIYNIEQPDILYVINKDGICIYNIKEDKIENFENHEIKNFIDNNNFILNDSQNTTWISSSKGIIKYIPSTDEKKIIEKEMYLKNTLSSNFISCFFEDRNGTMWIGTDKGVNILSYSNQFNSTNTYQNKYMHDKNIVSIIQDDEILWIATKFNGIYIFDKYGNLIKHLYEVNDNLSLSDKHIKSLFKISYKYIVIITNKDIITLNTETNSYKQEFVEYGYSNELNYIYDDKENVWVSSTSDFISYNIETKESEYYNENLIKNNVNPGSINYILQDKNDEDILWLGGVNIGLVKFHKKDGFIKKYNSNYIKKGSLISDSINCMIFDELGNLWMGTNIGLSKLDIKSDKFTSYTTAEGLSNNFINSILIDNDNNLWISTNKGLNKFDIIKEEFLNFTKTQGISGYQFNLNSSINYNINYSDSVMVFGSTNGLTYFYPKTIEKAKKYDEKVVIGDIHMDENKVGYNGSELALDYNDKYIYIDYFLPNYENLNNITYEYMIEGIDSDWIYVDNRNSLEIKYLDPGKYTLKLRARDVYGYLTEETHMNIKVNPPIWKTPLAYFIYTILAIAVLYYILNYVKILQYLVDQKTIKLNKQLEENKKLSEEIIDKEKFKNNYFVNLSHELRTPINIISSTVQLINAFNKDKVMTKEKSEEYMSIISKSCDNLLKIIGDIIDTSKIETGEYKIYKKNNDIVYIVEETALNMRKYIEKKGISLIIDPDIEEKIISCDATEIERCVINLLGNAVKFTPEGGEIMVHIKEINNYIEISVEDTGIGISKEDQEFIFKRFSQVEGSGATKASSSGIGLTLVKYVAELHGGYIRLESELNKGSIFTIGLPDVLEDSEVNNI